MFPLYKDGRGVHLGDSWRRGIWATDSHSWIFAGRRDVPPDAAQDTYSPSHSLSGNELGAGPTSVLIVGGRNHSLYQSPTLLKGSD